MVNRSATKEGGLRLKRKVLEIIRTKDLDQALDVLQQLPARRIISPLFSLLLNPDPGLKWATVTAIGVVVAKLAQEDMESARVIMRRAMWQLNEESGGIGWGCPESMGEIMARHEGLAKEYAPILISYVRRDANFLSFEPLQRGVVWGLGRLAQVRPRMLQDAIPHLLPLLEAEDPTLKGLAVWALGVLGAREARSLIVSLMDHEAEVEIYLNGELTRCRVKDLAKEALQRIGHVS
jgi:hypothetical protein